MTRKHSRTSKKYKGGFAFPSFFGSDSDSASGTAETDPKAIITQSTKQIQDLLGKITDAMSKLPDVPKQETPAPAPAQMNQTGQPMGGGRRRRRTHRRKC
jgi:hypothetical protein